tara:strand:- start:44 stop:1453 length:1410 start_codon:yes stop_codon:yes gene_type:complete
MIDKKDLKILFLYPNQHMRVTPPGGIAIISACLKRAGFTNIHLFDSTWFPYADETDAMSGEQVDRDKERAKRGMFKEYKWSEDFQVENVNMYDAWRDMMLEVQPDVVISSIVEDTYGIWKKMIKLVDDQEFISIVGGVFPTSVPKLFEPDCDYIACGEGDETIPEMMEKIRKGESCKNVANVYPNAFRPAVDVNELPYTDHAIFPDKALYRPFMGSIRKIATIETQRGCPYGCKFCNSPEKNFIYNRERAGKFFRRRSIEHIEGELMDLKEKHNIDLIWNITDTLLTMLPEEFDEFCDMQERVGLEYFAQTRPETLTEYQAKRLVDSGCVKLNMGVEHGSDEFRRKHIGRVYDNELAINAFKICREVGLDTTCNFIMGYPYETMDYCWESVEMAKRIESDNINAFIFTPYHGTPLRQTCVDAGFISDDLIVSMNFGTEDTSSYLDMPPPYMSKEDIQYMFNNFVSFVYS